MANEQQLLEEALLRRECRKSFRKWCLHCGELLGQKPAKHHDLIIDQLEKITFNQLPADKIGVIILVPPGAAKSTYSSVWFPPWFLGQRPNNNILACSYSFTLAERFGKRCRNLIEEKQNVLGYSLSKHSQAAGDWATSTGSVYFAAGVGAGIAGHRADLGLIDDYLGTQEDADSKLIRDKQWDWFWSDFWPRLKPGAKVVIIANRRHEDDLVGRLLETEAHKWIVIKIPFFAEENDPLGRTPHVKYNVESRIWPEWFDSAQAEVVRAMAVRNPRLFAGLYQQRPAPEEGDFFKKEWIVRYKMADLPSLDKLRIYVGSDHAVKSKEENDKTCLLPVGIDESGRIWILPNWYWGRCDTGELVDRMLSMAEQYKPLRWWAGSDHITQSIGPFLNKRMRERNIYFPLEEVTSGRADKSARAQSIAGRMSQKMVMFPDIPEMSQAEHEMLTFPGGTHDDFVDALAEIGRGLDKIIPPSTQNSNTGPDKFINELNSFRPTVGWLRKQDDAIKQRERIMFADN